MPQLQTAQSQSCFQCCTSADNKPPPLTCWKMSAFCAIIASQIAVPRLNLFFPPPSSITPRVTTTLPSKASTFTTGPQTATTTATTSEMWWKVRKHELLSGPVRENSCSEAELGVGSVVVTRCQARGVVRSCVSCCDLQSAVRVQQGFLKCVFNKW